MFLKSIDLSSSWTQVCTGLPLLQAVINETLRRYPTIIATLPRTATQDTVVSNVAVPKGVRIITCGDGTCADVLQTIVGIQNYTIHLNEEAFPNAEEWNPDRWLAKEGEEQRKEAWVPFSVGPRKCIGIK